MESESFCIFGVAGSISSGLSLPGAGLRHE